MRHLVIGSSLLVVLVSLHGCGGEDCTQSETCGSDGKVYRDGCEWENAPPWVYERPHSFCEDQRERECTDDQVFVAEQCMTCDDDGECMVTKAKCVLECSGYDDCTGEFLNICDLARGRCADATCQR